MPAGQFMTDTLFGLLFAPRPAGPNPGQIRSAPVLYYSLLLSDPVCVFTDLIPPYVYISVCMHARPSTERSFSENSL
jgi:hypothetical protein